MHADAIIQSFRDAQPVRDINYCDSLVIAPDPFPGQVNCVGCNFASFVAACAQFYEPAGFTNCQFEHLDFYATFFLKGLTMDGCVVSDRITFQSGGHNNNAHPFTIKNSRFDSFVDFEDCWFTGPFRLENVVFRQGTNLLGNRDTPMVVSFDFEPEIANCQGTLNINTYSPPDKSDS